jgi:hypothetical protein
MDSREVVLCREKDVARLGGKNVFAGPCWVSQEVFDMSRRVIGLKAACAEGCGQSDEFMSPAGATKQKTVALPRLGDIKFRG